MDNPLPKAICGGHLGFLGLKTPVYVLEDKRRMISARGLIELIGMSSVGASQLATFLGGERLNPFVPNDLTVRGNSPILCALPNGGKPAYLYEAKLLVEISKAVIAAWKAGALKKSQEHIAERCLELTFAYSELGIVAHVDEATGYQEQRPADALEVYLNTIVKPYPSDCRKQFDDDFYAPLCALLGFKYHPDGGAPSHRRLGQITDQLIYDRLGPGVKQRLRAYNPRRKSGKRNHMHHQHLTDDYGVIKFTQVMTNVKGLLKCHTDYKVLMAQLDQMHPRLKQDEATRILNEQLRRAVEDRPMFPYFKDAV